jgi:protein-S-isoprenylcysteine O-methyltransferase Ste14
VSGATTQPSFKGPERATWIERLTRSTCPGQLGPVGTALLFVMNVLLSMTLAIAALTPLHVAHSGAAPLPPLQDGRRFDLEQPTGCHYAPGDEIPLYRFFGGFQSELGRARVVAASGSRLHLEILPETFVYPPGRQGFVTGSRNGWLELDLGKTPTFAPGDILNVFENYQVIGKIRLQRRGDGQPLVGRLTEYNDRGRELVDSGLDAFVGLTVSEYTVQSTLLLFSQDRSVIALEVGVLAAVFLLEVALFARWRLGLIAVLGGALVRPFRRLAPSLRSGLRHALGLALAVPLSWFTGRFIVAWIRNNPVLGASGRWLPANAWWLLSGSMLLGWVVLWAVRREHLALWAWRRMAFVPRWWLPRLARVAGSLVLALCRWQRAPARHYELRQRQVESWPSRLAGSVTAYQFVAWMLHLFVFWAFAYALTGFMAADINVALGFLVPDDSALQLPGMVITDPHSIVRWLRATASNLGVLWRTGPAAVTFEQATAITRFLIYAAAIAGCMIGYVHSVLKAFAWTSIRNVDFTPLGWLTAAMCYSPLLGYVVWTVIPFPLSPVPAITQGPLFYAMLVTELLLNVFYTMSLYNMLTKFGVLVDKGMVDSGFYSMVRHPSYTLEAFMLIMVYARMLQTGVAWLGVLVLCVLYWLRSEREDVFMTGSNPEYARYKELVPYKYIRGLV